MTKNIFEKIIDREIPADIVYEDENHLAFLDITPFSKGHTLVIPKKNYENISDMPENEYLELQKVVLKLTKHYREILKCKIGQLIYGLDVSHVHIHIFPLTKDIESFKSLSKTKTYLKDEKELYSKRLKYN